MSFLRFCKEILAAFQEEIQVVFREALFQTDIPTGQMDDALICILVVFLVFLFFVVFFGFADVSDIADVSVNDSGDTSVEPSGFVFCLEALWALKQKIGRAHV